MEPVRRPLFEDSVEASPVVSPLAVIGKGSPRLRKAERFQGKMFTESLDQRLDADHTARTVWDFVMNANLTLALDRIKAVEGRQGRDANDPRLLLALWLFASIEGVNSARVLAELCRVHRAYEWLCGGVSMNYHTLASFRSRQGELFKQLMAEWIASLMHAGLVEVNTVAQDGMRIRASAGNDTFRRAVTLEEHLVAATRHMETLEAELQLNPQQLSKRRQAAQQRAAREKKERWEQAIINVQEVAQAREARKKGDGVHARASTTDPESRRMKMPDGGIRPAYNAQYVTDTKSGVILAADVCKAGNDSHQLQPMMAQVREQTGQQPAQLTADGSYNTRENVDWCAEQKVTLYTPIKEEKKQLAQGKDPYAPHKGDSLAMIAHRERMKEDESKAVYGLRCQTAEWVHAQARNRGLYSVRVRGVERVRAVVLLMALAHNLLQAVALRAQQKKEA
jgi:transposase